MRDYSWEHYQRNLHAQELGYDNYYQLRRERERERERAQEERRLLRLFRGVREDKVLSLDRGLQGYLSPGAYKDLRRLANEHEFDLGETIAHIVGHYLLETGQG